jgi:hypothetical protein
VLITASQLLMESCVSGGRRAWFLGGMVREREWNKEGISNKCLLEKRPGAYHTRGEICSNQGPVPELAGCAHEETYSGE